MSRISLLAVYYLLAFLPWTHAQPSPLDGLDAELQEVLKTWYAPGFAVAVVKKDSLVYARGFGYRNVEEKLPVTANSLFAIGSCTKAFTTGLLGLLAEEGMLSFDESPLAYLPELRFKTDILNTQASVRDIITHRTGLPRHDYSWYLFPTPSKDSLLMRVQYQEPFAGLREQWYYNNFMYLAQGVIAERITGKSWEENIRERFFSPLSMHTSNLSIDELEASEEPALGYVTKNDSLIERTGYYRISGMAPAGSINSSVREMGNWLIAWINKGQFEGEQILPASYVPQAISSHMVVGDGLPSPDNPDLHMRAYGFGWFLSSYRGHFRVEHGGNIDGFSANTCFFPTDSIGIVVLANQGGSSVPSVVRNLVADRMLGLKTIDWNGQLRAQYEEAMRTQGESRVSTREARVAGTQPSHILQEYTGTYTNPGYGTFKVSLRNDSLIARFPLGNHWLRHFHYDIFEPLEITGDGVDTSDTEGPKVDFYSLVTGEIGGARIQLEPALEDPIDFSRSPEEVAISKQSLAQYVGKYSLPGQVVEIYSKEGDKLYLRVPGQPEYELIPTAEHTFSIRPLQGYSLAFEEDADGKIEAVLFQQPNGTFRAEKQQ